MSISSSIGSLLEKAAILGDAELLYSSPAVILNSRQSKTPVGNDPWVKSTIAAAEYCAEKRFPVIVSTGMNTWELALWAVCENGGKAIVIAPLNDNSIPSETVKHIAEDFRLCPSEHAWILCGTSRKSGSEKEWWNERDNLAFELADILIPVSIRDGGRWDEILGRKRIDQELSIQFGTEYRPRSKDRCGLEIPPHCFKADPWPYITHWTCRAYGPWPGESSRDFYRAISLSGDEYPRSAERTLVRILEEGLIRGSGRRIRGGCPVVSFTALAPSDAMPLMRWRKRYCRPTFEPYGIAIHARSVEKLGIRQVTYIKSGLEADGVEPEMTQGYGTGDWPSEAEWRAIGDVDIKTIPPEDVLVLAPSSELARDLRGKIRYPVHALCEPLAAV
jgi:hypothetical protein